MGVYEDEEVRGKVLWGRKGRSEGERGMCCGKRRGV